MTPAEAILGVAFQGTDLFLMARLRINVGGVATLLQQSHVDTITYNVYEAGTPAQDTEFTYTSSLVVFNTLQTGSIWTVDKKGYNFGAAFSRLLIPDPFKVYFVPVRIKLVTSGDELVVQYKIKTKSVTGV